MTRKKEINGGIKLTNSKFKKLLEPASIGRVKLKNRMIKTAQGSSVIEMDTGFIGKRALGYYGTLAKGGIGLLIVESCGVEYPLGTHHGAAQFRLHEEKQVPSFSELTKVVHEHGCPIFLQLIHSGPWNPTGFRDLHDARCSSTLKKDELPGPDFVETQEMTIAQVQETIQMFIKSADLAYRAGFDGVEVNAATCTLPNSFFSRVFNKRTDDYGVSSLENRARFVTEIVRGIKKHLGSDFPVIALINGVEFGHKNGTTLEEAQQFARLMEQAGADAIQVRAHYYGHRGGLLHADRFYYPELIKPTLPGLDWSQHGKAAIIPLAIAAKKVVSVPVFAACRLDPVLGEKLLQEGKVDFVGMTRRILADPELPRKVIEGRLEDIRPCLGCLYCMDVRLQNKPVKCRVNAQLNREWELTYQPALKKKKVLVIGSGPSGMEAARVAAIRGHDVTIYDKEIRIGGLLPLAALLKDVEVNDIMDLVNYFKIQFNKLGVKVKLGQLVNATEVDKLKPDVIIIATGGKHTVPDIPGIESKKVVSSAALHNQLKFYLRFFRPQMLEILTRLWMPIGKRVIVIGGRIQGCEVAEFLVKRGRKVTIVDNVDELGEGMTGDDKFQLFPWFEKKGVNKFLEVKYNEITSKGLTITTKDGKNLTLEADTIVTSLPVQADLGFIKSLEGKAPEVYSIGDCVDSKLIAEATAAGAITGNSI
jgi:2,4-dienoyl-CoA reductase (NADPH2)